MREIGTSDHQVYHRNYHRNHHWQQLVVLVTHLRQRQRIRYHEWNAQNQGSYRVGHQLPTHYLAPAHSDVRPQHVLRVRSRRNLHFVVGALASDDEAVGVPQAGDEVFEFAENGVGVVVEHYIFLVVGGEGDEGSGEVPFVVVLVVLFDLWGDLFDDFPFPLLHSLVLLVLPLPESLVLPETRAPLALLDPAFEGIQVLHLHLQFLAQLGVAELAVVQEEGLALVVLHHFDVLNVNVLG